MFFYANLLLAICEVRHCLSEGLLLIAVVISVRSTFLVYLLAVTTFIEIEEISHIISQI